jgi:predicted Rossmann fold flavoprotein
MDEQLSRVDFDVAVIGAGAAGMMAAAVAGQRGRQVVLLDHAERLAEKIRISGGGRCNFTNLQVGPNHFHSANPHFCRSALARYTPADFLELVDRYGIAHHEKHRGQLFCDSSSQQIIDMLVAECERGGVAWRRPGEVRGITRSPCGYTLECSFGALAVSRLVIATGGLSIPKIGATDFGFRVARQFGLPVVPPRPALVPLTFDPAQWQPYAALAGVSLEVEVRCQGGRFLEDLLFTHRGLSGPAILQISSFWEPGLAVAINLVPQVALAEALLARKPGNRQLVGTVLAHWLPKRLADHWVQSAGLEGRPIAETPDRQLRDLAQGLTHWEVTPAGSEGYRKAEVTRGGVDTRALDSRSMEAKAVPGLFFVGEVVDVTGWLGGYNFQWAWSSGFAAGSAV